MADINVKQKSSNETKEEQQSKAITKREKSGAEVWRSRGWDPFAFSPSEVFSGNPFSLMRRMSEEMDRTFGRFFGDATGGDGGSLSAWYPAVEVAERDGQLQVHADLPGLKPEDVKVEITDNFLVIQGERKYEREENNRGVYRSERRYGHFHREIPLPQGANTEQAKAQFHDGVLEVKLPVSEQAGNRRQIPIESSGSVK